MQPGEGKLHLGLDARGPHHTAARRLLDDVFQQRRLTHAGFATYHQCLALSRPDSFDEPVEHIAFAAPARQLCRPSSEGPHQKPFGGAASSPGRGRRCLVLGINGARPGPATPTISTPALASILVAKSLGLGWSPWIPKSRQFGL